MKVEDYRRILDFFFSGVEVTEELKRKYLGWLSAHGNESEVKALLEEYWDSVPSVSPEFDLTAGLERLMASLGEDGASAGSATGARVGASVVGEPCRTTGTTGSATGKGTCVAAGASTSSATGTNSSTGSCAVPELVEGTDTTVKKNGWLARFLAARPLRYCAAVAASVAIFIGGFAVARLGMTPERETVLMASSDNTSSYTLPDGTRVWLNRGGRLSYNQDFGGRERIVAIDGEGYFEVARNENCPFIVNMHDNLQVKVLGTEFNVLSNPADHSAEVILRSGSVQVSDTESKDLVILKPDQKFSWDMGRTEVTAVNADDCCRWYEHRLSFDNVRLCDILESLSHKYQTRITCNATDLKDKRMSLTVRDESLEDIMEVVSTLLPVRWERHGMTIIIDNKNQKH